jgi:hypothetical protein
MKNISIYNLIKKEALWGIADSNIAFSELYGLMKNDFKDSDSVEFNLHNISSVDYSFIKDVFIRLINMEEFNGIKIYFSDLQNYEIVFHLDDVFKINGNSAFIKIQDRVSYIGANKNSDKYII